MSSTEQFTDVSTMIEVDHLIIGAGPAGASLACFLASYGLKGLVICAAPGTAETPRAHITNMAALECLRDIGLEEEVLKNATPNECMSHTRWCRSMAGEEYARIYSWGNDPKRKGDYDSASHCTHVDIPQTILEPILVRRATHSGFKCRFNTVFLSFEHEKSGKVVSKLQDNLTEAVYYVQSKYLYGCDGARSRITRQLDLPLMKKPGQGVAMNVLADVDLSRYLKDRVGNLHWVQTPDEEYPDWAWSIIVRMVKPWHEWMFIVLPKPGTEFDDSLTEDDWMPQLRKAVGDDSLPIKILGISKWTINEIVAESYSEGNIFCLGDAVHRHPPFNGLGSNTCVQDAYNLAWKIAYVEKGLADPKILSSYSAERQPVGVGVVTRANQGLRDHFPVCEALGMLDDDVKVRTQKFNELAENSPAGVARRAALQEAVYGTRREFHGVGQEMNQRYESSAVYLADEGSRPPLPEDPILEYQMTTYPGSRLPHAWLNTRIPGKRFSTHDLAGHSHFCLFTSIGGDAWREAGMKVGKELGLEIKTFSIGWKQDYEDVYSDWTRRKEVEEDGVVLVRPDRFVAWRSKSMIANCEEKLMLVMKSILSI
ncbi:hypothetical protein M501DRAFT_1017514 [Patellaria atrata CBS 101060]|uniref:FAD-binding domain-containing protein n=1 Tax=Patellaria atrata CBS 101060 TaxID=1346257 RepID=A0A9P4S801_9PEZI|nr:hypothetical protein M501DRAFT_1017514 [Patellaria atrata CBS 101060]